MSRCPGCESPFLATARFLCREDQGYGRLTLRCLRVGSLHPGRALGAKGDTGKVDAQLAHSMDGRHWLRGVRDPLFANGPPGSPTAGLVYPNSALLPSGAQPTAFERRLDVSELETCLLALQREDQATRGGTIFCCTHPPRQSSTAR